MSELNGQPYGDVLEYFRALIEAEPCISDGDAACRLIEVLPTWANHPSVVLLLIKLGAKALFREAHGRVRRAAEQEIRLAVQRREPAREVVVEAGYTQVRLPGLDMPIAKATRREIGLWRDDQAKRRDTSARNVIVADRIDAQLAVAEDRLSRKWVMVEEADAAGLIDWERIFA